MDKRRSQNGLVRAQGEEEKNNPPSEIVSPRVTLQPASSLKKSATTVRPTSSFPNYIGRLSSEILLFYRTILAGTNRTITN